MNKGSRWFLWLTGWAAALTLAMLPIVGVAVWFSKKDLAHYRKTLEERGEKFVMEDLAPPKASPTGNGGEEVLRVGESLAVAKENALLMEIPISPKEISPGVDEVLHKRPKATEAKPPGAEWSEVEAELAPRQPQLARLRELANSPELTAGWQLP